jgi:toxin FitB
VTRYLVDTNVLSATAPTTAVRRPELIEWMDSHSPDLLLSAITIAEIADGIAKAKREGTKRKASDLAAWLRIVLHLYGDRVLPFAKPDSGDGRRLGRSGTRPRSFSGLCRYRNCCDSPSASPYNPLAQRAHFAPMDVVVVDPYQKLPVGK